MGPERPFPGHFAPGPVLSLSRITLENNGKTRPQPDRENAFAGASGGGSGIRTLGTLSRPTVFKTAAIDHSAKPPWSGRVTMKISIRKDLLRDNRLVKLCSSCPRDFPSPKAFITVAPDLAWLSAKR